MAYSVKSSAERHTKNRHGEKRERNRRQFAGVERRRASLRNARGWRVRELLHSDADPHSYPHCSGQSVLVVKQPDPTLCSDA
jgi:hypothetical protein